MPGTFPIPQQSFDPAHGPYVFGPQALSPADSEITLTVDRTPPGGLNATPNAVLWLEADWSADGGATWTLAAGAECDGGTPDVPPPKGPVPPYPSWVLSVGGFSRGPGRQVRAVLTVSGSPVVVTGTVTAG